MPKLTHTSLINIGKTLGYNSFNEGVCHGFSLMWLQAILVNDENTFYYRLHYLAKFNNRPNLLKEIINSAKIKVKNKLPLVEKEQLAISILAFFDGVALYLHPREHTLLFNKIDITQQHSCFIIMSTASLKTATHWAQKNNHTAILSYLLNKPLFPLSCPNSLFFKPTKGTQAQTHHYQKVEHHVHV